MPPGTMEITTVVGCKVGCRYCPQSRLQRKYRGRSGPQMMPLEVFRGCVAKVPPEIRIDFSGMAEPWLNRECTAMLLHAAEGGREIAVYTTLVGMTRGDFDAIKDVTFDYFVLHVPDAENNSRINVDEEYLRLLETVVRYPLRVTGERQYSCHGAVHPAVEPIVRGTFPLFSRMIDRAGNLAQEGLVPMHHRGRIHCGRSPRSLNHNVLLPDGTVLLCCMDYNMEHVLGNLLIQDYDQLFDTAEYRSLVGALEGYGPESLCRRCSAAVSIEGDEEALTARVEALFLAEQMEAALRLARENAERFPGDGTNWNNLGVILHAAGQSREARGCFLAALARNPRHTEARRNLHALGL